VLLWIGILITLATGFCAAFLAAACAESSEEVGFETTTEAESEALSSAFTVFRCSCADIRPNTGNARNEIKMPIHMFLGGKANDLVRIE
jgi:hypothetical protein